MWSLDLHQERTLPPSGPDWLSSLSWCRPSYPGLYSLSIDICHVWPEASEVRNSSQVTSMDRVIYGAVMMLTPRVKSLRDSLIKTICVFSMTEPILIWNPKPSTWINQHQRKTSPSPHQDLLWEVRGRCCPILLQWPLSHTDVDPTISGTSVAQEPPMTN